jgi:hypothetical protein
MWRRVSCEQPLNTSQSILRLRGSLVQLFGTYCDKYTPKHSRKGIWSIFQNLVAEPFGSCIRRGNATRLGDAHWSSGKSCLFCISRRGPGILSQGEWVLVLAKSAAVLAASTSAQWDLENPREITADSHQLVPISAAGLQG